MGGHGLRPVVSRVPPKTVVRCATGLISADNPQRTTSDEIWRDAGFDGRDARATILKTRLLNCGPFRYGHDFRERGGGCFHEKTRAGAASRGRSRAVYGHAQGLEQVGHAPQVHPPPQMIPPRAQTELRPHFGQTPQPDARLLSLILGGADAFKKM